jgi:hypothetical protein
MATMKIDTDVRDGLRAGTINAAEAQLLMDARRKLERLKKRYEAATALVFNYNDAQAAVYDLTAKLGGSEAGHDEAE